MKMGPASNRQVATKKSLRIWVRNNGHVVRKDRKMTYIYPRTVEAAKDPFVCDSGKNKMFYLIAINLFPDSKIVKPDDSESEDETNEMEIGETEKSLKDCESKAKSNVVIKSASRSLRKRPLKRLRNNKLVSSPKTGIISGKSSCNKKVTSKKTSPSQRQASSSQKSISKKGVTSDSCSESIERSPSQSSDESLASSPSSKKSSSSSSVTSSRKAPTNFPMIMNNLQKIIQTCSETGKISFSLSKTTAPRQSRS